LRNKSPSPAKEANDTFGETGGKQVTFKVDARDQKENRDSVRMGTLSSDLRRYLDTKPDFQASVQRQNRFDDSHR